MKKVSDHIFDYLKDLMIAEVQKQNIQVRIRIKIINIRKWLDIRKSPK